MDTSYNVEFDTPLSIVSHIQYFTAHMNTANNQQRCCASNHNQARNHMSATQNCALFHDYNFCNPFQWILTIMFTPSRGQETFFFFSQTFRTALRTTQPPFNGHQNTPSPPPAKDKAVAMCIWPSIAEDEDQLTHTSTPQLIFTMIASSVGRIAPSAITTGNTGW